MIRYYSSNVSKFDDVVNTKTKRLQSIESISLNPDTIIKTAMIIADKENRLGV